MDKFPSRERSATIAFEPRVSAIVVIENAGPAVDLSLRSVFAEPWIDDVVIVDANNSPEVSSALRALQADRRDVKLVRPPDGLSPSAACNFGADQARGRWLLFLDPHVVLQRGAVARMAAAGGGAQTPWIVGGRLTDARGREQPAVRGGALNTWSTLALAMDLPAKKPRRLRRAEPGEPSRVASVSGAFMLMPRSDFQELGGFDENFETNAADLDLCRRAAEAGGSILFQPDAAGVQFARQRGTVVREAQGLALFAAKSARNAPERVFAFVSVPLLALILVLRDLIIGKR